ncbi:MAG: ATPase domain-containing protein [Candidatus Helarchaeota archaeon]
MQVSLDSPCLNSILEGGFKEGQIYHIFGESGSGKSIIALQCACELARHGKRSLIFDMDRSFTPLRLKQLAGSNFTKISEKIFVHVPENFKKFVDIIEDLETYLVSGVKLLIFDTITAHYRPEPGKAKKNFRLGKKFNQTLALIWQYSQDKSLITILCNQVHADIEEGTSTVFPRAGKLIRYWSNNDFRLEVPSKRSPQRVISLLEKDNLVKKSCRFELTEQGCK